MYARMSFYDMGGASKEDAVRAFDQARSALEQMEGSQGGTLFVSTNGDKAITVTLWETEEAMRGSAEQANRVREQAAGTAGLTIREVEGYEVALQFGPQPAAA